jgi:hypothetical protein
MIVEIEKHNPLMCGALFSEWSERIACYGTLDKINELAAKYIKEKEGEEQ